MSRSKKKNPFSSITCIGSRTGVMKAWKKNMNRKLRRRKTTEEEIHPDPREMGTHWQAPNDGKYYEKSPKGFRK